MTSNKTITSYSGFLHGGDVFYFAENYNETSEKVFLGGNYTDVLTGEKVTNLIKTDGYEIRILKGDVHGDI